MSYTTRPYEKHGFLILSNSALALLHEIADAVELHLREFTDREMQQRLDAFASGLTGPKRAVATKVEERRKELESEFERRREQWRTKWDVTLADGRVKNRLSYEEVSKLHNSKTDRIFSLSVKAGAREYEGGAILTLSLRRAKPLGVLTASIEGPDDVVSRLHTQMQQFQDEVNSPAPRIIYGDFPMFLASFFGCAAIVYFLAQSFANLKGPVLADIAVSAALGLLPSFAVAAVILSGWRSLYPALEFEIGDGKQRLDDMKTARWNWGIGVVGAIAISIFVGFLFNQFG